MLRIPGNFKFCFGAAMLLLSSCSSLLPKASIKESIILAASSEKFCDSVNSKGSIGRISEEHSPEFFRSQKIIYRKANQLGSYQLAEWSESLDNRLLRLSEEKLRCAGFGIGAVEQDSKPFIKKLSLTILDFSHYAGKAPGNFKVKIRVQMEKGGKVVEKLFSYSKKVESYDVNGARKAADQVVEQFLTELVEFTAP